MKHTKKTKQIAALTLAASFLACANAQAENQTNDEVPSCKANDGKNVIIQTVSEEELLAYNVKIALSIHKRSGKNLILIDKDLKSAPKQQKDFIIEHECAHHSLGHVMTMYNERRRQGMIVNPAQENRLQNLRMAFELEADCKAISVLQQDYGYHKTDILEGMSILEGHDNSSTHPDYKNRLENAMTCLN